MLLYPWISIEPKWHDRDTVEGGTRDIKGTKDVSLPSENEEAHRTTDPLTEIPHREGHALNVDKWATLPETAREEESKRTSTSLITMMRNWLASHQSLCHGIAWRQ